MQESKAQGKTYTAASGSPIKNRGEKMVSLVTRDGKWKNLKSQVCDVTGPLAMVHKICEAGHSVVFNPSWSNRGSYITNHVTKEKLWLTQKDGVFVLETKVAPMRQQARPSFGGQGR